jgi:hypothetical protein
MLTSAPIRVVAMAIAATLFGCASADVNQTYKAQGALPMPDLVIVHTFAVTPAEVQLDRGLMAGAVRGSQYATTSYEETQVGHIVADKLAQKLVDDLQAQGITAVRDSRGVRPSATTLVITGEFTNVDQGNQSKRVWIGFGLGGSTVQTTVHAFQGGLLVAEGETSTASGLKPGMAASAGVAVATGGVAPLAVGAAGAAGSEAFLTGVESDASRTAEQIAKKIKQGYINRGWLAS